MRSGRAKAALRAAIAAPGVRHGLRWFLAQPAIPATWRSLAHRKLAKRARFPGGEAFTYTTPEGTSLEFLHGGTTNYLYWLNEYEPVTTTLFCRLARAASVVLDIGAADGIYSIFAAAANPNARILAFEPGTAAAVTCQRNLELNQPRTRNVALFPLALGERDEQTILYVAGETGGTSSLNPGFRRDREEQAVTVRRGETLLDELAIDRVDLIKIDTESTEPAVLRGLVQVLRRDHPDIICEVLPGRTERALEELARELGYQTYQITDRGLVLRHVLVGDASYREPNFLFSVDSAATLASRGVMIAT